MNTTLRNRLLRAALAIAAASAGAAATHHATQDPPEVLLAWELGAHFESSGEHIGKPYIDRLGKGQPWTVCAGVTGPEVDPRRYYSPADCRKLETKKYQEAERIAKRALVHWDSYNIWVRASFIDVAYNVPSALAPTTTLATLANRGDLVGACQQMPRWVYGTVNGVKTRLPGLVDRRGATNELCAEWGRNGHFSADLIARSGS